jgi:hypothetical protein
MPRAVDQAVPSVRLGLLAYGSLLWDPGPELEDILDLGSPINGVETQFNVEFARSTRSRGGGPTLVPVATGGAPVIGAIFPFRERLPVREAQTLVWRREVRRSGGRYDAQRNADHPDKVFVDAHETLHNDFEVVLVVRIAPNIEPLNGDELATRAILSARTEFGSDRKDGISYLIGAKDSGIETPLQSDYEAAILRGSMSRRSQKPGMRRRVLGRADDELSTTGPPDGGLRERRDCPPGRPRSTVGYAAVSSAFR